MERKTDIYQLLRQDHQEARQMFQQLKSGRGQMGQTGMGQGMSGSSGSGGSGGMGSDTNVRGGGIGSSPEAGRPGQETRGSMESQGGMGQAGQGRSGMSEQERTAMGQDAMATGGEGRYGSQGRPTGETGMSGGPEWQGNRSTGWQGNQATSGQGSGGQMTEGQGQGGSMSGTRMGSGSATGQQGTMGGASSPQMVFSRLQKALTVHMDGEERLFYTELEKSTQAKDMVREAYQEHNNAKQTMQSLMGMAPGDQMWMSRLEQLEQMIEHHVQEEEGKIFQTARQVISEDQAMEIGRRFQQEKQSRMAA